MDSCLVFVFSIIKWQRPRGHLLFMNKHTHPQEETKRDKGCVLMLHPSDIEGLGILNCHIALNVQMMGMLWRANHTG